MGLFDTKYCGVCGMPAKMLNRRKLLNGYCCRNCEAMTSPWFNGWERATVEDIRYQVSCRGANHEKLQQFTTTRQIGNSVCVMIDETNWNFLVTSPLLRTEPDVISLTDVTDCEMDILEEKAEIKYKDKNGEKKSFNPRCYAHSYNVVIDIFLRAPYIPRMRFQLNDRPIDNDQPLVVEAEHRKGLLGGLMDAVMPDRSYNNGKTSNADEVRASSLYRKYVHMGEDIRSALLNRNRPAPPPPVQAAPAKPVPEVQRVSTKCTYCRAPIAGLKGQTVRCPYCDSKQTL